MAGLSGKAKAAGNTQECAGPFLRAADHFDLRQQRTINLCCGYALDVHESICLRKAAPNLVSSATTMPLPKKDIERHYFDRFQALLQPFPRGSICSTEEPDFLVTAPNQVIGVELTELHREPEPGLVPLQATEAMRQRVASRAQELYVQNGHPPVRCTILMNDVHIKRGQVEPLAKAIVDIVLRNLPAQNASANESFDWVNRSYFPELIDSISVHRLEAITQTHFNCPGATWLPKLASMDIERVLVAKEAKYSAYRQRCDEAWLLVNVDIGSMSSWFNFQLDAIEGRFTTSFDRVFIMRHFGQALHELVVAKPS